MTATERNRLARDLWWATRLRVPQPSFIDMACPALDAAGCLDAPHDIPAGSMVGFAAWAFPSIAWRYRDWCPFGDAEETASRISVAVRSPEVIA